MCEYLLISQCERSTPLSIGIGTHLQSENDPSWTCAFSFVFKRFMLISVEGCQKSFFLSSTCNKIALKPAEHIFHP